MLINARGCVDGCDLCHSHTHTGSCFACQKLIKIPTKLKFDLWSPSTRLSIIKTYGCGSAIATHSQEVVLLSKQIKGKTRLKFGTWFPKNWVNVIKHVWVWFDHSQSYFGCQELIYIPIMLKFNIWTPSNWLSIINMCGW